MINPFNTLRDRRLAEATREFHARGKSVVRCSVCQLAQYACICPYRPELSSRNEFVLLLHRNEVFKPTNTGRLIADALPANTRVSCWHRTEPEAELLALLADPQRRCCVVFPDDGDGPSQAHAPLADPLQRTTFLLLDGTWKQGRRMLRLSRWLDQVPRLTLPDALVRGYTVRKSLHEHQLATAEAGALCLALAGETAQSETLHDYFSLFNLHYKATRGCCPAPLGDLHQRLLRHRG
ncbi:tRNA-uridine aminocarboxypropyltransferase [Teredinibacter turnerae]|uniref:tRNA-uridine aminocarboxypropyltransferase n=1 Tax=Teredinibacter turnerae TaxID=2426 RepID=UPI00037AE64F|nr:DTW domain-containing protein [Teredinibacter turnerae]